MIELEHIPEIYTISRRWFVMPTMVVFLALIGKTVLVKYRRKIAGFAIRTGEYLHYMAVSERLRGKGYGRRLFRKILPHIRSLGVRKSNYRAIRFYKSFGFRIVRKELWITGPRYIMSRD